MIQRRLHRAIRVGGHKQAVLCHGRGSAADAKVGNIESGDECSGTSVTPAVGEFGAADGFHLRN